MPTLIKERNPISSRFRVSMKNVKCRQPSSKNSCLATNSTDVHNVTSFPVRNTRHGFPQTQHRRQVLPRDIRATCRLLDYRSVKE
jgi:hypothetical protein